MLATWLTILLVCGGAATRTDPADPADPTDPVDPADTADPGPSEHGHRYAEQWNPTLTDDGLRLVEFDVVAERGTIGRNVLESGLWPRGQPIRFVIDPGEELMRPIIVAGLRHWMDHTCVVFEEAADGFDEEPHLRFVNGSGCYSTVGRLTGQTSGQEVSIGPGCGALVTVLHEVGHALGLFHEQARPDRDRHVEVLWDNIQEGRRGNFQRFDYLHTYDVSYDLTSIMHYAPWYFRCNSSVVTLLARDPLQQHLVGRRPPHLTHRDKAIANRANGCGDHCRPPPACQGEGYVDEMCRCVCPDRVSGERCEVVPAGWSYYGPLCGDANITTPTTIKSVGYPTATVADSDCYWRVTAPAGRRVLLTLTDAVMDGYPHCSRDRLSIRLGQDLRYESAFGCGHFGRMSRTFVSDGRQLMAVFRTRGPSAGPRRFSAEVAFVLASDSPADAEVDDDLHPGGRSD